MKYRPLFDRCLNFKRHWCLLYQPEENWVTSLSCIQSEWNLSIKWMRVKYEWKFSNYLWISFCMLCVYVPVPHWEGIHFLVSSFQFSSPPQISPSLQWTIYWGHGPICHTSNPCTCLSSFYISTSEVRNTHITFKLFGLSSLSALLCSITLYQLYNTVPRYKSVSEDLSYEDLPNFN